VEQRMSADRVDQERREYSAAADSGLCEGNE